MMNHPRTTVRTFGLLGALLFATVAPAVAQGSAPVEALDGLDPVLLVQGKEVAGKADLTVVRGRFQYLFSSADTKSTFEREPAKYEIQLGGMCARMGKTAGGNPADYLVHDGKIYIFGSDECHRKFQAAPAKYLATAAPAMPSSPDAAKKGRALVDRAAKALGGADRIDGLTTYSETVSQVQKRPQGEAQITTKTMWRFPDATRVERTMVMGERKMTSAQLLTPAGAWYLSQGRAYPAPEVGRPSVEMDLGRNPVALIHARHAANFKAAALGSATVAGMTVDQVRVQCGAIDVVLGLDPASARLQTITFTDRNNEGEVGTYTLVYSDYRPVEGLTLPFAVRGLFNGEAEPSQTYTIESIAVNPQLDASLFATPAAGGQ
jgi:YHS domain-containing protein